jgi:Trk K+ transport system NAD-binding subunit
MDIPLLQRAGIENAEAVVVTTDGDNSNIVIGQMALRTADLLGAIKKRAFAPVRSRSLERLR